MQLRRSLYCHCKASSREVNGQSWPLWVCAAFGVIGRWTGLEYNHLNGQPTRLRLCLGARLTRNVGRWLRKKPFSALVDDRTFGSCSLRGAKANSRRFFRACAPQTRHEPKIIDFGECETVPFIFLPDLKQPLKSHLDALISARNSSIHSILPSSRKVVE